MSDEHAEPTPQATFMLTLRDRILDGTSVYGDPKSHRAEQKLLELDARIDFARRQGELPPEQTWTPERVAAERLQSEFPRGEPSAVLRPEHHAFLRSKLDALATHSDEQIAVLSKATTDDLAWQTSRASFPHSAHDRATGNKPPGYVIADALVADAEPVIMAMATSPEEAVQIRKLLRADRSLLEAFAVRGQAVTAFKARRVALGLDPVPEAASSPAPARRAFRR